MRVTRAFTLLVLIMILLMRSGSAGVEAQPGKVPKIGVLLYAAAPKQGQSNATVEAFRVGLRDLGYVEGRNVIVEYRWAGGSDQRAASLRASPGRAATSRGSACSTTTSTESASNC